MRHATLRCVLACVLHSVIVRHATLRCGTTMWPKIVTVDNLRHTAFFSTDSRRFAVKPNITSGESKMSELKSVARDGFNTIEAARADARKFAAIGGKVIEGGARDSGFGWTGEIRVDDTCKSVAGTFHCGRCAGTGAFITGSMNGKPTGPGGICFRCEGKGRHTAADRKRNFWHDQHAFAAEARRMMA